MACAVGRNCYLPGSLVLMQAYTWKLRLGTLGYGICASVRLTTPRTRLYGLYGIIKSHATGQQATHYPLDSARKLIRNEHYKQHMTQTSHCDCLPKVGPSVIEFVTVVVGM